MGNWFSSSIDEKRKLVKTRKPGQAIGIDHPRNVVYPSEIRVGLYGKPGVGKTSFINSIISTLDSAFKRADWYQVADESRQGGQTYMRTKIRATDYLAFVDNRGIEKDQWPTKATANEVIGQIEGRRRYHRFVEWDQIAQPEDEAEQLEQNGEKIHCTVFVFKATGTYDIKEIADLMDKIMKVQGRFPIGVITHIDKDKKRRNVDPLVGVLKAAGIVDIFEVENLHENRPMLQDKDKLNLLDFCAHCMTAGDHIFLHQELKPKAADEAKAEDEDND